jgi:hypothetical protein
MRHQKGANALPILRFNVIDPFPISKPDEVMEGDWNGKVDYNASRKPPDPRAAEHRLMLAMLIDAINVVGKKKCPRRIVDDAREWLLDGGSHELFSASNVCDELQLSLRDIQRDVLSESGGKTVRRRSPVIRQSWPTVVEGPTARYARRKAAKKRPA